MKIRQINLHMKWGLLGMLWYLSCCWDSSLQNQQKRKIYRKKVVYFYYFNWYSWKKTTSKENKAFCRTVDSYGYKNIIQNKTIIIKF